jgi:arylsulfatase A-like enzyme
MAYETTASRPFGIPAPANKHRWWLAERGAVFQNAFCTNSICVPSSAAITTGQYSHRNGVFDLDGGLSPDSLNFATLLQQGGYKTELVGKWHLKGRPEGFDHFLVLPGQGRYRDPVLISGENWREGESGQSRTGVARDPMPHAPGWEFYDLVKDPGENRNAIGDRAYSRVVAKLKKRLKEMKKQLGEGHEANKTIETILGQHW